MSGIVNKIKEAVHGDKHSAPEGSHGPHNTRAANAADPRVDSDRDGSHQVGTGTGMGTHTGTSGLHSGTGTHTGTSGLGSNTHGTAEGTHGPHSSRIANAADPRVDSDRDGSRKVGGGTGMGSGLGSGMGSGMGHTGAHTGSSGLHTTGTNTGGFGSSNTHHAHAGTGMTGMTGTHGDPAGTHGPHSSRVANAADPRVDSDRDGRGAIHTGPGPAPNTAGPHKSDMMNKVDPRVDSDLDGSKTMGQNKTYQQSTGGSMLGGRPDPTDAAQVPPSVMQRAIGEPTVAHDDKHHHRERRNSTATHQESFAGI
ncbi:hypothetical protein QBC39DRAFT_263919 [Podospora conica]|nr:hypothetical protein QBC39DRAFT_263919 [Schizothecium conicum]